MDIIGRLLLMMNPRAAVQRQYWRDQHKRLFEAGKTHHQHRAPTKHGSGDASMEAAREKIRDWARYLDENHDLAIGILSTLVDKTVGAGIKPMPMVLDANGKAMRDYNKEISALWREWSKRPEVTHEYTFDGAQRMLARTLYRDGEVLGQHVLGNRGRIQHGSRIPYSLEMIEADFLPFDMTDRDRGIIHGVEKTAWGRPRAYHLYKEAPEYNRTLFVKPRSSDLKRVPADRIFHAKFTRRIGQTRGVSVFHGVAFRLDDIKDYEESERIAARIGASMAAYIKKSADMENYYDTSTDELVKSRTVEMKGGMIYDNLLPGEEVGTIDVDRPNSALLDFRNSQLRAIAMGTGTDYSSISRDYQSGTYSSQRQEMVAAVTPYAAMREYQIAAMFQPCYEQFITAAVLSNQLRIPPGMKLADLFGCGWIAPPQPWIDPAKEAKADQIAREQDFVPWSQIVLQRTGRDPHLVLQQLIEESEWMAELADARPKPPAPGDDAAGDDDEPTNPDGDDADDEVSNDE